VRPHPHINLATVTYLFEGRIPHRDCLGAQQTIEPGEVNWSTPPNSRGPWAYRRSGFHSFPRDPRVQQIEQQAFRHDAPEIVSRGHHLGEGVAENQLLLSEENQFGYVFSFWLLRAVRSRCNCFHSKFAGPSASYSSTGDHIRQRRFLPVIQREWPVTSRSLMSEWCARSRASQAL
jgi:pirin-like protein